jgi:hypothetical protein
MLSGMFSVPYLSPSIKLTLGLEWSGHSSGAMRRLQKFRYHDRHVVYRAHPWLSVGLRNLDFHHEDQEG